MNLSSDCLRIAIELAATVVVYRFAISPGVCWSAREIGCSSYPRQGLNGAYPEGPPRPAGALRACSLAVPLTALACAVAYVPGGGGRTVPAVALALVLWKCLTLDYDVAQELGWQRTDRIVTALVGFSAVLCPPLQLLTVILLCGRLGGWTHHSMACLRIVKAAFAWSLVAGVVVRAAGRAPAADSAGMLILLGAVFLSHYLVAFASKWRLGGNPWAWALLNRTELLIASAYTWGWMRFLPQEMVRKIIALAAPWVVVLNAGTLLIEGLGLAAFADLRVFLIAVVGAVLFNVVVAFCSGLLFWDNIAIGTVLAVTAARAPADVRTAAFGFVPWLMCGGLLLLVLCGGAWKPTGLGWWDTPFAARVYWTATARAGGRVGIYNHLLCPFDREYGRAIGNPLTTEPFVTFSMSGVEDASLRDRLIGLRLDGHDLEDVKNRYGQSYWNPEFKQRHVDYLSRFFTRLNSGTAKSPLPRSLRWFKAPGSHLYYWGALPRYRRRLHGPVQAVQVRYQEVLFRPERRDWHCVRDELLFEFDVAPAATAPPDRESRS